MTPYLYEAKEKNYLTNGLGPIADATSCVVTEELNGAFTLKLTVPRTTARLSELAPGRQILVKPNPDDQAQPFRIQRVSKSLRGELEIYAPHVAYDLARRPVQLSSAQTFTSVRNMMTFVNAATSLTPFPDFTFSTEEPDLPGSVKLEAPVYAWDLLAEGDATFQTFVPGEWKFDRYSITQKTRRGTDRGYAIAYGKNMTELTVESDDENLYTGYLPIWKSGSDLRVGTLRQTTQTIWSTFGFTRILIADCSEYFNSKPSVSSLDTFAFAKFHENIGQIELSIKVAAVPPGSRGLQTLEELQLGDTITVKHDGLGVDVQTRVVQTVYDVLRERFTSVDVSNRMIGAATTIARIAKRLPK